MSDLTEFLLARIAEDEAVAREATPGPWHVTRSGGIDAGDYDTVIGRGDVECMPYCYGGSSTIEGDNLAADTAHIARHDPARVLAKCAADRRIVEREARFFERRDDLLPDLTVVEDEWRSDREWVRVKFATGAEEQMSEATYRERFMRPAISNTLRLLALPYADHPDYREEWRP